MYRFPIAINISLIFFSLVFVEGATAAVLKRNAAVDGNRKKMADRVSRLQVRLGNEGLENHAARASPLRVKVEYR